MMRKLLVVIILLLFIIVPTQAQPDCDAPLEIWQVQGAGGQANCLGERIDTPENLVTAVGAVGFFIQTPAERSDDDPMTSDGVYVYLNTPPSAWGIQVGDLVNVNGRVDEFFNLTEIIVTGQRRVEILSSGNPIPEPIDLRSVELDYTPGELHPLERYEGMLVTVEDAYVSAATNQFDEFGITLTGERSFREPGVEADRTPELIGQGLPEWDLNPELIEVDPPEMGLPSEIVTFGSTVDVTGALAYSFQDYQIWPVELDVDLAAFTFEPVPERDTGEFTVGALNLLNLFDLVDDPNRDDSTFEDYVADNQDAYDLQLGKLSTYIREVLRAPDILGVQEMENSRTLSDLIFRLNADDPDLRYAGCILEGNEGRGIDVAYLVRVDTINILDCYRMPGSLTELQPDTNDELFSRPPLVLEAEYVMDGAGFPITVINVHIKSLGGIETEDVQERRFYQAVALAEYVQQRQNDDPEINLAVIGDFNAFQFTDGIVDVVNIIAGADQPDDSALLVPEADIVEPNLVNQALNLPPEERYSFVFNSSAQILDHILTTRALDRVVTGVAYGRGNADAPVAFNEEPGPLRASDHDGMVIFIQPGE